MNSNCSARIVICTFVCIELCKIKNVHGNFWQLGTILNHVILDFTHGKSLIQFDLRYVVIVVGIITMKLSVDHLSFIVFFHCNFFITICINQFKSFINITVFPNKISLNMTCINKFLLAHLFIISIFVCLLKIFYRLFTVYKLFKTDLLRIVLICFIK